MSQLATNATITQIITSLQGTVGTLVKNTGIVITPSSVDIPITLGSYDGTGTSGKVKAVVVPPSKVLNDTSIAGITGTVPIQQYQVMASSTWTNGTGLLSLKVPTGAYVTEGGFGAGFTSPSITDANFVAGNIKSGVSVLGITGTAPVGNSAHGSQKYPTAGTYSFTVPVGVYIINAIACGGGGGGGGKVSGYFGGGGGGGGLGVNTIAVTPSQIITVVVGGGGAGGVLSTWGSNGATSSIGSVTGAGGAGGGAGDGGAGGGAGGAGSGYGISGGNGTNGYNFNSNGGSCYGAYGFGGSSQGNGTAGISTLFW